MKNSNKTHQSIVHAEIIEKVEKGKCHMYFCY